MKSENQRQTTPEEEGIELFPDALERLERAVKTAARHGPIAAGTIKGRRVSSARNSKPKSTRR